MSRNSHDVNELIDLSQKHRLELLDMCYGKGGHFPSTFSIEEILNALLHGGIMNHDIKDPNRDHLIISEGHAGIALYPSLVDLGYVDRSELEKFMEEDGLFRQYPDRSIPLVDFSTGSLGHGLGVGSGLADEMPYNVYVIMSDGEFWEGSVQEAMNGAARYDQRNLIGILNNNGISILGETTHEPLKEKWESYGWFTQRINGHSYKEIFGAFERINSREIGDKDYNKPSIIIADTIKGKGIQEIEGKPEWHNKMPSQEQYQRFRKELETKNYITF